MSKILIALAFVVANSVLFFLLLKLSERKRETSMVLSYILGATMLYTWMLVWFILPSQPSVQQVDTVKYEPLTPVVKFYRSELVGSDVVIIAPLASRQYDVDSSFIAELKAEFSSDSGTVAPYGTPITKWDGVNDWLSLGGKR